MATPAYRQDIRPGQHGRDVKGVKLALKHIKAQGSADMKTNRYAGTSFVHCVKSFQHNHKLKVTGVYNKETHNVLIKQKEAGKDAFSWWAAKLYRTASLRNPPSPPILELTAKQAAAKLLQHHSNGSYVANNSGDLYDLQRTAQGQPVWSQAGYWVYVDKRPLQALLILIEKYGFHIGTFAICSDHHYDGPHGHAGGNAVDISSINGIQVGTNSSTSRSNTLKVAKILRYEMPDSLRPWQQICDGYGYVHDSEISSCTVPGAYFYGYTTMSQHRNHIHLGYY